MNLPVNLFIALRYSFGHHRDRLSRFIAVLTGVGLVLGVTMMITVLSVMNGFDKELRERILVVVPHITLSAGSEITDWRDKVDALSGHPKVTAVHPYTELEVLARYRGSVEPMLVYAVDSESEIRSGGFGELLGVDALERLAGESSSVLLGAGLANNLGVSEGDDLGVLLFRGDSKALQASSFRVAGIMQTGTEVDQRLAIIDLKNLAQLQIGQVHPAGLRIQTTDIFNARDVAYELARELGSDFRPSTWATTHGNLYEAIQMSRHLVSLIVLLILAIAGFNVISTLMISSADKQNELAVLKTLGATPKALSWIFTIQGLVVGLVGSFVGVVLGILLASNISAITVFVETLIGQPILKSDVYPLDYLPSDIHAGQVLLVFLTAVILSVVASLYPAAKVSKVDPAEVLRYE